MSSQFSHTCAALSTANGKAGIAVIRASGGDDAIDIASKVFRPASGKALSETEANRAVFGTIFGTDGNVIDTGIATCFIAPHSYTGENTVEISCHGSPVGTSLVLAALYCAGAKPAIPGEFTRRAFINGKIDLTQAEAVGELLDSESVTQLRLSTGGSLGRNIRKISDGIEDMLAAVYAYIDYPDEDMADMTDAEIIERIGEYRRKLEKLSATYSTGLAVTKGVKSVIAGSPNTGKSTFFNLLSGYDRAIVTDVAGTTRDVISETVEVCGIKLHISDTAGIRETSDGIEKIGVEKSREAMEDGELIIALFDVSKEMSEEDEAFAEKIYSYKDEKNIIIILNKTDKAVSEKSVDDMKRRFENRGFENVVKLSAKTGGGKKEFEEVLLRLYPLSEGDISGGAILTSARQYSAVTMALEAVKRAERAMKELTRDMAGLDLEEALSCLCEADGRKVSEEVVGKIFSHFCVGK